MGKIGTQPEATIHHFSHEHPLYFFQLPNNPHIQNHPTCSACNLTLSGWNYGCAIPECNRFLHVSCAQIPQQINHPCHHNHPLFLASSAPLLNDPDAIFKCDACGMQLGNGFSYKCGECKIGLHTACANLPMMLTHQSHQHHLTLVFSAPYANNSFSCDVCHNFGCSQWLYRCNICEFDAHLGCATQAASRVQDLVPLTPTTTPYPLQQRSLVQSASFGPQMGGRLRPGAQNRLHGSNQTQRVAKFLVQGMLGIGFGTGGGGRRNNNGGGSGAGSSLSSLFS